MECPDCGYTGISQLEYDLYECQMCGYRGSESDFEGGGGGGTHYHSYYYSYNVSTTTLSETPATCTTSGSKKVQKVDRYVCSCGDWENRTSTSTQTIAALGHNFTYTSTVVPGMTTDGYDLYTCSRCYITEQRNLTKAMGSPSWTPMKTKTNNAWTNITNVFYKTPAAWVKMNGYYAKDNNSWNVPVIEYDESSSGGSSSGGTTGGGTTDTRASCPVAGCYGRVDASGYGYRCDRCGQYTTYCSICNNGELAYPDGAGLWCVGHGGYIDTYGDPIE